jgi:hypothetical protein
LVSFTEDSVIAIIKEAREAGRIAAQKQLETLMKAGPQWNVVDGFTGNLAGQMLDVCGGAWINIDAKQSFYRAASKMTKEHSNIQRWRFHCGRAYRGGGMISIYDSSSRQEMSINESVAKAQMDVLVSYGVKVNGIHSYID